LLFRMTNILHDMMEKSQMNAEHLEEMTQKSSKSDRGSCDAASSFHSDD